MYESFFNLRVKPFDLLPDPKFIYQSKSHKKAMIYLDYGIRERSGFVLLTGEVGSGKTTLIRDLLNKCYENVVVSKIFNTLVTSDQLLSMINDDFGLAVQGKDKVSLIRDLNEFLIDQYSRGNQPILIIDEAQNLSEEQLEEIRMLSNLEDSNSKLLQIILVGQPELRAILATPKLRQLRQRININCHLQALNRVDIELYIAHRLEVAGNLRAVTFSIEALDAIFRFSRGIPRLINIICDFLMFLAFAEETTTLTVEMVNDVIGDLDFENYHWTEAAGEEEQQAVYSSSFSSAAVVSSAPELQNMLAGISQRIESIGHNISATLHSELKDQNDQFVSFQKSVGTYITKSNYQILDLNTKLKDLRNTVTGYEQCATHENLKIGFFRRLFGGDTTPNRK